MKNDSNQTRSGQVMIFMALVLVILFLVVLWNFDLHKILFVKNRTRNAGDAAALAAARWQGISLNLIGNMNVLQAVAISDALMRGETNFPAAAAISDLQTRLCFTGPMTGFFAAQQAAKNNGIYVNSDFTDQIAEHAQEVRDEYNDRYPVQPYLNDPSPPTCWDDYADMLTTASGQGIAAAADNMHLFYDYANRDHYLLNPDFYDSVSSRSWCWFFFNAMSLLENYSNWQDWPQLPLIEEPQPINCEIFGLGLTRVGLLEDLEIVSPGFDDNDLAELLSEMSTIAGQSISTGVIEVATTWLCYQPRILW